MALIKQIELDTGAIPEYWKITGINFEDVTESVTVTVELFINKQARLNGKKPVAINKYMWSNSAFSINSSNIKQEAYNNLKLLSEFQNTEDDLT